MTESRGTATRILLPIDLDVGAEPLLTVATRLARSRGAIVRLLYVAPPPDDLYEQRGPAVYVDEAMARLEAEAIGRLRRLAGVGNVPVETAVRFGDPATAILRETASSGAHLVVLGGSGADAGNGSGLDGVAQEVCRRASVPVLVYRGRRAVPL